MNYETTCLSCFREKGGQIHCPHCGFTEPALRKKELLPARTLLEGRYLIGEVLEINRMTANYKALDIQENRTVEIKEFYPREYAARHQSEHILLPLSPEKGEAFFKAIRTKESIGQFVCRFSDSDNLLDVYECFRANNTVYLACEYLEGMLLSDYLENCGGAVDSDTALTVAGSVLSGLDRLHKSGMIHRAIAPQNIFITVDDRIKIINFGFAKSTETETEPYTTLIFTPGYAAPEQSRAHRVQGPYTDIYAVGAMLYHMLTGEKPSGALERMAEDHLLPPAALNGEVSEAVNNAVMKALAIDPGDRFQSAEAFREALLTGNNSHAVTAGKKTGFARSLRSLLNITQND